MQFSQEYIISQVANSYDAIEKAQKLLNSEKDNLENFLLNQGYLKDGNVYVHPKYIEIKKELDKTGGYLEFPSWAVVIMPS